MNTSKDAETPVCRVELINGDGEVLAAMKVPADDRMFNLTAVWEFI